MRQSKETRAECFEATSDAAGLAACQDAINTGLANLQQRGIDHCEVSKRSTFSLKQGSELCSAAAEDQRHAVGVLRCKHSECYIKHSRSLVIIR